MGSQWNHGNILLSNGGVITNPYVDEAWDHGFEDFCDDFGWPESESNPELSNYVLDIAKAKNTKHQIRMQDN